MEWVKSILRLGLFVLVLFHISYPAAADTGSDLPVYLQDRGTGVPTSMFGTYINRGELLVYPFYEFYYDHNLEYESQEFGFRGKQELQGESIASEELIFLGYGLTGNFALELEAGIIQASLDKSPDDLSKMPDTLRESGLSDVQIQLDLRWLKENERRPALFNYFEVVFPTGEEDSLIGTSFWEFKLGMGAIKGFGWGTVTARLAVEYSDEENKAELGEYALEYLKRISPAWRLYLGVEGSEDELELIPEAQWHINDRIFIKFNSAFGLTPKATDWAPEIGIMFRIG